MKLSKAEGISLKEAWARIKKRGTPAAASPSDEVGVTPGFATEES